MNRETQINCVYKGCRSLGTSLRVISLQCVQCGSSLKICIFHICILLHRIVHKSIYAALYVKLNGFLKALFLLYMVFALRAD